MIIFPGLSPRERDRLGDLVATKMASDIDDANPADILAAYESRFPRWTFLMDPDKCVLTLRQLVEKSLDFYHHIPTVLEIFVLVRSMEDWIAQFKDDLPGPRVVTDEDQELILRGTQESNDLKRFIRLICPQQDLVFSAEELINDALYGGQAYLAAGIKLEDYFEIIPPDVMRRLQAMKL